MRTLSGPTVAALSAPNVVLVQLMLMGFATPIALNSSNWNLLWGGVTYKGAFGLGAIGQIDDAPGEIKGLNLEISGVDSASISLALDDAAVVQGTALTIRTAILDSTTYQIVDAPIEWVGTLDSMSIQEDGETCAIGVTAESSAVDLLRGVALTYSDADQRSIQANDLAFQWVVAQANAPIIWPSKVYFIAMGGR